MVAIVTKYLGPTNSRGSRIVVKSNAGKVSRITVSWDHALNPEDNHAAAAHEYARRNDWLQDCYGKLVGGALEDGYAFVFVKSGEPARVRRRPSAKGIPACAAAMGCLCAGHARGNNYKAPCDTSES